ncbi:UNVERIFIED_CONTAM: hypothetical protein Slati_2509000 [Sesamum latifolium]|uniref:Uncharacterized protein n=1 Tax=Sesamum latifolium TaxID=2727402 RepID=A0AAW2WEN5_9LAMI
MVIKMDFANFMVHKVLVDNGSFVDILFMEVLRKMEIGITSVRPVCTQLIGFGGSEVIPLETIDLPVSIGKELKRKTMMIKFLVVETPLAYNVILGRPGLNLFKVVVSTFHLKIKFATMHGIGELKCDQKKVSRCYNLSVKKQTEGKRDIQKQFGSVQQNVWKKIKK